MVAECCGSSLLVDVQIGHDLIGIEITIVPLVP
jgi:hypothetical protein